MTYNTEGISFLEVEIVVTIIRKVATTLCRKSTAGNTILHADSADSQAIMVNCLRKRLELPIRGCHWSSGGVHTAPHHTYNPTFALYSSFCCLDPPVCPPPVLPGHRGMFQGGKRGRVSKYAYVQSAFCSFTVKCSFVLKVRHQGSV